MESFKRHTDAEGWRYSLSYRTRRQSGTKDWQVERWNGEEWERAGTGWNYADAREIATKDSERRALRASLTVPTDPRTDAALAQALYDADKAQDMDEMIAVENEIAARLNLPLDETEQGLTHWANDQIKGFCKANGVTV